jgi:hypothetical protein
MLLKRSIKSSDIICHLAIMNWWRCCFVNIDYGLSCDRGCWRSDENCRQFARQEAVENGLKLCAITIWTKHLDSIWISRSCTLTAVGRHLSSAVQHSFISVSNSGGPGMGAGRNPTFATRCMNCNMSDVVVMVRSSYGTRLLNTSHMQIPNEYTSHIVV